MEPIHNNEPVGVSAENGKIQKKEKTHFTWDSRQNPNRISKYLINRPDFLAQNPDKKQRNYALVAFFMTFLGMGIVLLLMSLLLSLRSDSGDVVFSLLYSDSFHQYFPFFKAFREILRSGRSLLFNWDVGMGVDYLGLYAYYLGSPLNLLSVIIPENWLISYFTLLTPVRLGLASMFFAIFLKKVFQKNDLSIALFGTFYATCAWSFGYMWNTMWLDTFALLPLVVLGTLRLLKNRKFVLYTVTLFLSVFINYYIGFFTCIFVLLVFICYQICRWENSKRFFADLGLMAVFTALAIGMTAVITLPAFASLQSTNSIQGETLSLGGLNMTELETEKGLLAWSGWLGLFEAMRKSATNVFAASPPNTMSDTGLPNLYCGVFATVFSFLFLTCRQVKKRDRICAAIVLLFLNLSFIIRALDYIWHGFHFTNMIPYRFSFLYSFVMLYMAYRAFLLRHRFKRWQLIAAAVMVPVLLLLSEDFFEFINKIKLFLSTGSIGHIVTLEVFFFFANIGLIAAYFFGLFLCCGRKKPEEGAHHQQLRIWYQNQKFRRSLGSLCLVGVICLELVFSLLFRAYTGSCAVNASDYPRGGADTMAAVSYMQQDRDLFYRTETEQEQIYNDGALIGYNGITTFTSSANADVSRYLKVLGYSAREGYNRYAFTDSSPLVNMFLNLKYVIDRSGLERENAYFTEVFRSGDVALLENNYYLPLGFMVDPQLAQYPTENIREYFLAQNDFLSAALGNQVQPWQRINDDLQEVKADEDITLVGKEEKTSIDVYLYSTGQKEGNLSYIYNIDRAGQFCTGFNIIRPANYSGSFSPEIFIYKKAAGTEQEVLLTTDKYTLHYTLSGYDVQPGDQIRVQIKCPKNVQNGRMQVFSAILDQKVMDDAFAQLSQSVLTVTEFKDTEIKGTITCQEDGLLYTSIPQYGENWSVYVDGEEKEITKIGDAMIGVMLEAGEHTVVFRYRNNAFLLGCIISAVSLMGFVAVCLVYYKKKKTGTASAKIPS